MSSGSETYSIKYMGIVDGNIGILSRRMNIPSELNSYNTSFPRNIESLGKIKKFEKALFADRRNNKSLQEDTIKQQEKQGMDSEYILVKESAELYDLSDKEVKVKGHKSFEKSPHIKKKSKVNGVQVTRSKKLLSSSKDSNSGISKPDPISEYSFIDSKAKNVNKSNASLNIDGSNKKMYSSKDHVNVNFPRLEHRMDIQNSTRSSTDYRSNKGYVLTKNSYLPVLKNVINENPYSDDSIDQQHNSFSGSYTYKTNDSSYIDKSSERDLGYPNPSNYQKSLIHKYSLPNGLVSTKRLNPLQRQEEIPYVQLEQPKLRKGVSGWKLVHPENLERRKNLSKEVENILGNISSNINHQIPNSSIYPGYSNNQLGTELLEKPQKINVNNISVNLQLTRNRDPQDFKSPNASSVIGGGLFAERRSLTDEDRRKIKFARGHQLSPIAVLKDQLYYHNLAARSSSRPYIFAEDQSIQIQREDSFGGDNKNSISNY